VSNFARQDKLLQVPCRISHPFNTPLLLTPQQYQIQQCFPPLSPITPTPQYRNQLLFLQRLTSRWPLHHILVLHQPLQPFLLLPVTFQLHLSILHNCRSLRMPVHNINMLPRRLTILLYNISIPTHSLLMINLCNINTHLVIIITERPTPGLNLVLEILMEISIFDCFNFFIAVYIDTQMTILSLHEAPMISSSFLHWMHRRLYAIQACNS